MKISKIAFSSALLSWINIITASSDNNDLIASWVQYTGGECDLAAAVGGDRNLRAQSPPSCDHYAAEVRAIFEDETKGASECPDNVLYVNGKHMPMMVRVTATDAFPNLVCYAKLPPTVHTIKLLGEPLPVPNRNPGRVAIMGDTGCRLGESHGGLYQSCNNPSLWPMERVSQSVLESNPDVVIHTGDYIYREGECPTVTKVDGTTAEVAGCKGSPFYDPKAGVEENFGVWYADWFGPGAAVFKAAPLILIRGNHELCRRAGKGYFRYLHHGPETECKDAPDGVGTAPWAVDFDHFQVGIMDTSEVKNLVQDDIEAYASQLDLFDAYFSKPAWITTHYPTYGWGVGDDDISGQDPGQPGPKPIQTVLQEVVHATKTGVMPAKTNLLAAAHIHLAEVIDFVGNTRPPQMVVANSGTQLVARAAGPTEIDGLKVDDTVILYQYGFVFMTQMGGGKSSSKGGNKWSMDFKDQMGVTLRHCTLIDRDASCTNSGSGSKNAKGGKSSEKMSDGKSSKKQKGGRQ